MPGNELDEGGDGGASTPERVMHHPSPIEQLHARSRANEFASGCSFSLPNDRYGSSPSNFLFSRSLGIE